MVTVRQGTPADARACAAIYGWYVANTATSFETIAPTPGAMGERIAAYSASHAWLVAELDGRIVGYAYGCPFGDRAAYRWSAEVAVYLENDVHRTGAGRALYDVLLPMLAERGYIRAVARIAVPNEASEGLHAAFGFETTGVMPKIGWKLGEWRDVAFLQRDLAPAADPPAEPV